MFTNEFDFDETVTTILDETGNHEDVQILIGDEGVTIRQWNDILEEYDGVTLSHDMFEEFQIALNQGEGLFKVKE